MPAASLLACPPAPTHVSFALSAPAIAEAPTDPTGRDLARLLLQVQTGDEAAFAELHARTRAKLRATVHPVLGSVDLVEDVLQDTYLQIWRQCHQFQPALGSVISWMRTIARRRAIDHVRSLARAHRLRDRHAADPTGLYDTDHQITVIEAVHADATISQAVGHLTLVEREALRLTYWDGLSVAEAAQLLGIPTATLKSRLHAATTRLRKLPLLRPDPAETCCSATAAAR